VTLRPGSGQAERLTFNPPSAMAGQARVPSAPAGPDHATPPEALLPGSPKQSPDAPEETAQSAAFIWMLAFTAVLFLRPQDMVPALEALHLAELCAVLGLGALVFGRLARRQPITRITPELIGVIVFGGVILATAPFSIWLGGAIEVFTDQYAKVILVYLLAVNVLDSPRRVERLTWLLVLAVGYIGFRAVWDYAHGANMIARGTRVSGSVGGLLQNPNDLALHMVIFMPFAIFLALRPGSFVKRMAAAACSLGMMGAIVASGSRGGFLGLLAMLVVLGVVAARRWPGFVLAGVVAIMCALPILPDGYYRRLESITDGSKDDSNSRSARQRLFGESFDAFVQNPITGVGAGNFKNWNPQRAEAWRETHNVWLQVAAEIGVFGLAVFMFLVGRSFYVVFQTRRLLKRMRVRRPAGPRPEISAADATILDVHSAAMIASLVGWLVCAFFASVAYSWTFYYLLALAAAPSTILRDRIPSTRKVRAPHRAVLPEAVRA
jgi:O-antigen ligase